MPWGMKGWTGRFDDPSYLSPFADELHAGYMRFKHIDDGTMWDLLKPGKEGIGLHVGQLQSPECCCGFYGRSYDTVAYKNQNNPWLFPSVVNWKSVMASNYLPHVDYVRSFDIDYPVVALTHVYSASDDFRWALDNVNYEDDTDRFTYEPNSDKLEIAESLIIGLVPIWSVVPLYNEDRIQSLTRSVKKINCETDISLLSECWCTIDHHPCDDNCAREKDYKNECDCKSVEKMYELVEGLYNQPIQVENYMDDMTIQTWDFAVNRFYDGWQVVSESAHQGEKWASYWQQAQSPFLGLPGQNFRDLQALIA